MEFETDIDNFTESFDYSEFSEPSNNSYLEAVKFIRTTLNDNGIALGVISAFTNLLIIVVMLKEKTLRKNSTNHFIISIALADLAFGGFFAFLVNGFEEGFFDENLLLAIFRFILPVFFITINLQVGLSADRFWAVCYPLSYFIRKNNGYKKWVILTCVIFGIFPLLLAQLFKVFCIEFSCFTSLYLILAVWIITSIAAIILLMVFTLFSMFNRRRRRRALFAEYSQNSYQQETRLAITMMMIIMSFFTCWLPLGLRLLQLANLSQYGLMYVNFFKSLVGEEKFIEFHENLSMISILVTVLNSLIDPLIYTIRMKEVRVGIKNLFLCKCSDETDLDLVNSENNIKMSLRRSLSSSTVIRQDKIR